MELQTIGLSLAEVERIAKRYECAVARTAESSTPELNFHRMVLTLCENSPEMCDRLQVVLHPDGYQSCSIEAAIQHADAFDQAISGSDDIFCERPDKRLVGSDILVVSNELKSTTDTEKIYHKVVTAREKNDEIPTGCPTVHTIGIEVETRNPLMAYTRDLYDLCDYLWLYYTNEDNDDFCATPLGALISHFDTVVTDIDTLDELHDLTRYLEAFDLLECSLNDFERMQRNWVTLQSPSSHAYTKKTDGNCCEVITAPSTDYKTQLRDLIHSGVHNEIDGWNIHTTFSGVLLDSEHHEVMDAMLVLAAAGIIPQTELREMYRSGKLAHITITESDPKISEMQGKGYYFPFHTARSAAGSWKVSKLVPYSKHHMHPVTGAQQRGLFDYGVGEFSLLVRNLSFMSTAVSAIIDEQNGESTKWSEFSQKIWELFESYGIYRLKSSEYFMRVNDIDDVPEVMPYNSLLTAVIRLSFSDPKFRLQVGELIRTFKSV